MDTTNPTPYQHFLGIDVSKIPSTVGCAPAENTANGRIETKISSACTSG